MQTDFMTINQAAQMLKVSRSTVYRLIRSGSLTPHYAPLHPKTPIFDRAQVAALLQVKPKES